MVYPWVAAIRYNLGRFTSCPFWQIPVFAKTYLIDGL